MRYGCERENGFSQGGKETKDRRTPVLKKINRKKKIVGENTPATSITEGGL